MNQIVDCMTNEQMKNPDESHVNKCTAKMNSMVEAKHGNALVRFGCGLSIKGREFPVLVKSSCQIQFVEKRFNGLHKLTDINAFEETTIKGGSTFFKTLATTLGFCNPLY